MKPRLLALTAATALVAVALTGCVRVGPMSSSTPEIDDVSAVVLDTSGDLTITEGDPSLTIHAPAGILDRLTSEVRDGVLVLGRRPGFASFGFAEIRYELTVRSLESIEINGSGDVESTVSGEELTIEINGSGDVVVTGLDAETVELRADGSGDIELMGDAGSLAAEIGGSGRSNLPTSRCATPPSRSAVPARSTSMSPTRSRSRSRAAGRCAIAAARPSRPTSQGRATWSPTTKRRALRL
nr:DUF2807 domain-containing protein [Pseudolysinimonas sp.]